MMYCKLPWSGVPCYCSKHTRLRGKKTTTAWNPGARERTLIQPKTKGRMKINRSIRMRFETSLPLIAASERELKWVNAEGARVRRETVV